ncbi:hypothetical protein BMF94_3419 [Rhodotorula taiwanensis]|uniref:Uncharacterized protein n=1 Tax=Rhodotorula taiwanensis TaxID=741276 RepID=A0A2S5B9N4_9BASI|nr:hypothetical protein BMF94_3419 [Rhodotorula taiwanensis]
MGRSFLLALAGLVATVAAQDLQISTPPAIYQCQAAAFSYTCPAPPCTIVARPSGDATSIAHSFGDVKDQSGKVSWQPVDQAQGSSVTLWITDKEGNTISSSALSVAAGSDDSWYVSSLRRRRSRQTLKGGSASKSSGSSDAATGSKTIAAGQGASTSGGSAPTSAGKASDATSADSAGTSATTSGDAPASTATDSSGAIASLSKNSLAAAAVGAAALRFLL